MKTPIAYLSKQSPLVLAGAAILVGGAIYLLARHTFKAAAEAAGGVLSGNNTITQNTHNLAGETTSAYEDKGLLGTLGAATNTVLGGIPATIGETLGGWAFDVFGPKSPK